MRRVSKQNAKRIARHRSWHPVPGTTMTEYRNDDGTGTPRVRMTEDRTGPVPVYWCQASDTPRAPGIRFRATDRDSARLILEAVALCADYGLTVIDFDDDEDTDR